MEWTLYLIFMQKLTPGLIQYLTRGWSFMNGYLVKKIEIRGQKIWILVLFLPYT